MKMKLLLIFLTFFAISHAASLPSHGSKIRYDNFSVFKATVQNVTQRRLLEKLTETRSNFNLWHSGDQEMHFMVNPNQISYFRNLTRGAGINIETMIPNVQTLIDEEQVPADVSDNTSFGWTRYNSLADIEAWLDGILAAYPDITEGFVVGTSYQGRQIRGIKISYKAGNPGVFIESNIHAREWITSATATWFINELLTSSNSEVRQLAENNDWYIVPVFNVDGFVYTHETDRMWRKTRQPVSTSDCIGTDPNRNFDSHWMENGGASSNPCSETYAGPKPFSEPEAKALADYIISIKDKLNILLAFHSYGQYVLSPYGHAVEEFPENYNDLLQVGKSYADAVKSLPYNTDYVYGSSASVLYIATGATIDWAFNEQDIKIAYTIEFRDQGRFGFILPPIHIIPNCEEAMAGMLALVKEAGTLGYLRVKY